jgi:metal-dependent amidase/aminoacylase/carboxypeptidase family protein
LLQSFSNINALRQSIHPDQRIHGIIKNGGTVPNIIPYHPQLPHPFLPPRIVGSFHVLLSSALVEREVTFRDYSKGVFMCRAMRAKDLNKLKEDVKKCFEAAAISTRCTLKITDKMNYKGPLLHLPPSPFYLASPGTHRYPQRLSNGF